MLNAFLKDVKSLRICHIKIEHFGNVFTLNSAPKEWLFKLISTVPSAIFTLHTLHLKGFGGFWLQEFKTKVVSKLI